VFEQGLALNTSIFYIDLPSRPLAIRTGHLVYRLYPDMEFSHVTATPGPCVYNKDHPLSPLASPSLPLLSSLLAAPPLVDPGGLQADVQADGAERDRPLRHDDEPLDDLAIPHTLLGPSVSSDTRSLLFHPNYQLEDASGPDISNDICLCRAPAVECYHITVPYSHLTYTLPTYTDLLFPTLKLPSPSFNTHVLAEKHDLDNVRVKTEPLDEDALAGALKVAPLHFQYCTHPLNPPLVHSPLSFDFLMPPNSPDDLYDPMDVPRLPSLPPIATLPLCIDPHLLNGSGTHCNEDDIDSDNIAMWDNDEYSDNTTDDDKDIELTSSDDPLDEDYVHYLQRFPATELDLPKLVGPSPHNTFMSIQEHHTITPFEYANLLADAQFPRNSDIPPMAAISHDGTDKVCCDLSDCRKREQQAAQSSSTAALAYTIFTCSYSLEQVFDREAGSRTICKYHLTLF
jgi:hypothetical protein